MSSTTDSMPGIGSRSCYSNKIFWRDPFRSRPVRLYISVSPCCDLRDGHRFKHINQAARLALEKGHFLDDEERPKGNPRNTVKKRNP